MTTPTTRSNAWWLEDTHHAASAITAILDTLRESQGGRLVQYLANSRLYGSLPALNSGMTAKLNALNPNLRERITDPATQVAVDTITAKMRKNHPKPLFLTSGGDYKQQRRAKDCTKWTEGVFYENRMAELGPVIQRDAAVFGDGWVHAFERNGRLAYERTYSGELWVDDLEAAWGDPRSKYRIKPVDRSVAAARFKDDAAAVKAIEQAPDFEQQPGDRSISDLIELHESWHLPSGKGAGDGKHILSTKDAVLFEEEYTRDFFPFARCTWSKRLYGYWGQGLVEQVMNLQIELNRLCITIHRALQLSGCFTVLLPVGAEIVPAHWTNDIAKIIKYVGTQKPDVVVYPAIPQEMFRQVLDLRERILALAGCNEFQTEGKKPAGLDAAVAIRAYKDEANDRLTHISENYENFHMDLARLTVRMAPDVAKRGGYKVRVPGKRSFSEIAWGDAKLSEDEYTMQCYPVSSLPDDPAGRLQTVQEYIQAGMLDKDAGRALLDFPDLDASNSLQNAPQEYITETLERMVYETGVFVPPEPLDDLRMARVTALRLYAYGKSNGVEEDRLELLHRWLSQVDAIEAKMTPPAPMPMEGAPAAVPTAPPVSDLLPNAPGAMQ